MKYAKISDEYSVATQIEPEDVACFAARGYRVIICNRPDGEDPGQATSASIREACERHGVEFHFIPVQGRTISPETLQQFRNVIDNASGQVLGYCRSGTRSAMLWQVAAQSR